MTPAALFSLCGVKPYAIEDIGIYQSIFEMLNVVGAVSTTAIVVFRSPIISGSQAHKDAVFIGVVTGFFAVIKLLECLIEDVHHDVALQIKRQAFIQSKIIDRVADEDDDLEFVEVTKKLVVEVRDWDDLELYYKTVPDYFEQDDGRKLNELPERTESDMVAGAD